MRDMNDGDDAPALAAAANGTFAVALQQHTSQLSLGQSAMARLYTEDGAALSTATLFDSSVISSVTIATLNTGDFAMTWQPYGTIQAACVAGAYPYRNNTE